MNINGVKNGPTCPPFPVILHSAFLSADAGQWIWGTERHTTWFTFMINQKAGSKSCDRLIGVISFGFFLANFCATFSTIN
jgi:hypothetical protein